MRYLAFDRTQQLSSFVWGNVFSHARGFGGRIRSYDIAVLLKRHRSPSELGMPQLFHLYTWTLELELDQDHVHRVNSIVRGALVQAVHPKA